MKRIASIMLVLSVLLLDGCRKEAPVPEIPAPEPPALPSTVSGDLPVLFIFTADSAAVQSKNLWLECTGTGILDTNGTWRELGKARIRGRGNTTWGYPKKPYALKFESRQEVLGMPANTRWDLLANWMDRTNLRNDVSFEVARRTSLAWTPRCEFVELVLNGEHEGLYNFVEHIKRGPERVPVSEKGFIVEFDKNYDEAYQFRTALLNFPAMVKKPDEPDAEGFAGIRQFINGAEAAIVNQSSPREWVDYESFADYWIVEELCHNGEMVHPKSTYAYRDSSGLLFMGPVWDFDWGTFTSTSTGGWVNRHNFWYNYLFNDSEFRKVVKQRWEALREPLSTIPDYIDSRSGLLQGSDAVNHAMWPIGQDVNGDESMSFKMAVKRMKQAYLYRYQTLESKIPAL